MFNSYLVRHDRPETNRYTHRQGARDSQSNACETDSCSPVLACRCLRRRAATARWRFRYSLFYIASEKFKDRNEKITKKSWASRWKNKNKTFVSQAFVNKKALWVKGRKLPAKNMLNPLSLKSSGNINFHKLSKKKKNLCFYNSFKSECVPTQLLRGIEIGIFFSVYYLFE